MTTKSYEQPETEAIHSWFSLSYANYLVLPRSLLQSMPDEWQNRFVGCLDEYFDHWRDTPAAKDPPGGYRVMPLDERKRFSSVHPAPHYRRGRTRVVPVTNLGKSPE